jgi:hypothetical protein
VTVGDYFPDIDRVLRIARVWPRIFAEDSGRTLPVAFEDDRLVVLCAGEEALALVRANSEQIVRLLNRLLDGDVIVARLDVVEATRTEMLLARDLLALKSWLIDFDIGI